MFLPNPLNTLVQNQNNMGANKMVDIDVSQVPQDKRDDSRFLLLLADMQSGCADPGLVHAICVHEAAHVFFLGHAGMIDPSACGPKITYEGDEFNGHGAAVKFQGMDHKFIAKMDSFDWLGRVAKGYAAGGVAARLLANSLDPGDGDDRENFNVVFQHIKSTNPSMTWTSGFLWREAQRAVTADIAGNSKIKALILACAEGLKPDLFRESETK